MVEGRVTAYPVIGAVGEREVGVTRRRAAIPLCSDRCGYGRGREGGRERGEGRGEGDKLSLSEKNS